MDYHGNQSTSPTWEEQCMRDPALPQQPENPVAYASRIPPSFQHHDPVITKGYSPFTPASIAGTAITDTAIRPVVQLHQPYVYSHTNGVVHHGNQIPEYDSESSHFDRLAMPAGIIPQEAWPSENYYQQQATYTTMYAPVGNIPFEQLAASHNQTHQATTQTNASVDMDASSDVWSPGVCPHASCLAKPADKQKNYREHSDWRRHWSRVHEKQHQCLIDGAMFGTANELKRHNEAMHQTGAKRHYCHVAGCQARAREFNRKDKFQEHNDRWHGPHCCPVPYCERGYRNGYKEDRLLADHMRIHRGP